MSCVLASWYVAHNQRKRDEQERWRLHQQQRRKKETTAIP